MICALEEVGSEFGEHVSDGCNLALVNQEELPKMR